MGWGFNKSLSVKGLLVFIIYLQLSIFLPWEGSWVLQTAD
jgi:hypothetical protein